MSSFYPQRNIIAYVALCVGIILSFFLATDTHAAVIIQRPLYIGLTNGLVGSWSFDGPDMAGVTAYDRSGNANNGTLTNGPVRAVGRIGQALGFDGVIAVPPSASL